MAYSRINLTRSKLLLLRNECKNRGIEPSCDKSYAGWPPEAVALLGAVPDSLLGAILGITQASVRKGRVALGIPSCLEQGRPRSPLTPAEARRLYDSGMTQQAIARMHEIDRQGKRQAAPRN